MLNKLRKSLQTAQLVHIKDDIYRMVDYRGRGYYWYVLYPSGHWTYHQTLKEAEQTSRERFQQPVQGVLERAFLEIAKEKSDE